MTYQITDKKILENWLMEKFLKKDMRKIKKEIYKDFGLTPRGYKEIDIMARKTDDTYFLCNIGQWPEEREANTYDYDIYIFDKNGKLIYDEADGELRKFKCYERFNNIKRTTYASYENSSRNELR